MKAHWEDGSIIFTSVDETTAELDTLTLKTAEAMAGALLRLLTDDEDARYILIENIDNEGGGYELMRVDPARQEISGIEESMPMPSGIPETTFEEIRTDNNPGSAQDIGDIRDCDHAPQSMAG